MFESRQYERTRQLFSDQFERNGAGYLYRKNMRPGPIQVSVDERDRFVTAFERSRKRITWALTSIVLVVIIALSTFDTLTNRNGSDAELYGIVAAVFIVAFVIWRRIWDAPARALRARPQVGVGRTRSETRRVMLARMSWGQLGTRYAAIAYGWWRVAAGHDLLAGWWRLWTAVAVVMICLAIWQALQKLAIGGA